MLELSRRLRGAAARLALLKRGAGEFGVGF